MKRRVIFWLGTLGLAVLAAGPAPAFVLSRAQVNGDWYFRRWPASKRQVRFVMNDLPLAMLPNLASSSTPLAAAQEAMKTWAIAPVPLAVDGTTSLKDAVLDGTNLITFADTPRNRDATANVIALTQSWSRFNGSQWNVGETDTAFNPKESFATDGVTTAYDIQAVLTHELGHVLGLNHSPIAAVTMFPYTEHGRLLPRALDPDDIAGMSALYHVTLDAGMGTISGQVLTTGGDPVLGAHVVATNADGIALIGALANADGTYTLPSLPEGSYQVYAEPLNGPTSPANYGPYYKAALTQFQPAFAGGDLTSTPVTVTAGNITTVDPIQVDPQSPGIQITGLGWSSNGRSFRLSNEFLSPARAGRHYYLVVVGNHLDDVPDDGFQISGSDLTLDTRSVARGTTTLGHPFAILPLSVAAGASPGPRNLYLDSGAEQVVSTGAVVVGP
jgi:hypothetical protein